MTKPEQATLAVIQEKQKEMTTQINQIRIEMAQNTRDTQAIRSTLDNMSGGKQALMWFTGLIVSILLVIAAWIGIHRK